jgi:spermidine synthase
MNENDPSGTESTTAWRWALAFAFAAGFLVQTAQIVLLRELLMAFSGLEVVIGFALASWMLLVALGGWTAAALLRRTRRSADLLTHALGAAFLPLGASALLVRGAPVAFGLASGELPGIGASLLMTLAVLAPTALTTGALFVTASKALEEARSGVNPGVAVGWAYLVEAGGSALAGALFSFLLVEMLGPFRILFFASLAVGSLAAVRGFRRKRSRAAGSAALLAAAFAAFLGGAAFDRATARWRWNALQEGSELAGIRDSRYGRIAVTRFRGQSNFFVSGHLAFSLPDRAGAAALAHGVLCEHPSPRSLLLVGGGVSGLVRECLKHPLDRIEYVELDPRLIAVWGTAGLT